MSGAPWTFTVTPDTIRKVTISYGDGSNETTVNATYVGFPGNDNDASWVFNTGDYVESNTCIIKATGYSDVTALVGTSTLTFTAAPDLGPEPDPEPGPVVPSVRKVTVDGISYNIIATSTVDQNGGTPIKFWTGTKAEYDAIVTKDPNTTYRTTDENETVYQNSYRIGQVLPSMLPISDYGLHLLDGAVIDGTGIYSSFYNYIAGLVSTYPNLFISESDWQTAVTTYGVCGKFVYDSTNQTIRLPKITGIIEGTTDATALGDLVQAGLPNITGAFSTANHELGIANVSGAFTGTNNGGGTGIAGPGDNRSPYNGADFDASHSSSIYGNSTTVQPQTIKVYYYIVIANSYQSPTGVQISKVATDLNGKVNLNSSWGFPTGQYIDLTLGSSGDSYTAPEDGYAVLGGTTSTNLAYVYLISTSNRLANMSWATSSGNANCTSIPVKKGQQFVAYFYNMTDIDLRFVYAQKDNN